MSVVVPVKHEGTETDDNGDNGDDCQLQDSTTSRLRDDTGSHQHVGSDVTSSASMVIDRVTDIIDLEVDHILFGGRQNRLRHYECLKYFWNFHPARQVRYGRRYILFLIAELLSSVCGRRPYGEPSTEEGEDDEVEDDLANSTPLYSFSTKEWGEIELNLKTVRLLALRKDATKDYTGTENDFLEQEAEETNLSLANLEAYSSKFAMVTKMIQINSALAPIRKKLEDAILAGLRNFTKVVGKKKIQEVLENVEHLEDASVQEAVLLLFNTSNGEIGFVEDGHLLEALDKRPFDLTYFQGKLESLLLQMHSDVLQTDLSVLAKLGYTIKKGSTMSEMIESPQELRRHLSINRYISELRNKRDALNNDHGEDPLKDALRVSEGLGKRKRGSDNEEYRESKKRSQQETKKAKDRKKPVPSGSGETLQGFFEDLDKDDEAEAKASRVMLSRRNKRTKRPTKIASGMPAPDPGIFDSSGRVIKRVPWTGEEKNCVREGVRKHGLGKWMDIKREFLQMLRNRTAVQIKDCWRTMTKKGEIAAAAAAAANAGAGTEPATETDIATGTEPATAAVDPANGTDPANENDPANKTEAPIQTMGPRDEDIEESESHQVQNILTV